MTKEEAGQIVIDAFDMWKSEYSYVEDWSKEDEALDMALKALDQEQKTGHWFAWKPEDDVWRTTCSECGEETRTLWDYCPHCGAKMSENEEV